MTAAYEIGYWAGDEWHTLEIMSKERADKYPGSLIERLKYNQAWERSKVDAERQNWVGWETWTHLPGSTMIRELVATVFCTKCVGTGRKLSETPSVGMVNCICDGEGTRIAQLEGELQEYSDRGY